MTDVAASVPEEELLALLRAIGVAPSEIAQAQEDGTLVILAIDRLAIGQEIRHDLRAATELTGLSEDDVRHIWRSLGFPDPAPGELVFSEEDVRNLRAVAELIEAGVVAPEIAFAMTRVVGSSMARVASAIIDAVSAQSEALEGTDVGLAPAIRAGGFLPMFPAILEQVWRRHLQVAARRRLLRGDPEEGEGLVVGFADLVGFTAMAQQATDEELAGVVDQFERLAYDVIVAGGGRVVKMIGDEVMFLVDDPAVAAEIALGIADASRDAADLTDVRVGLAIGPVLEREGDAFGSTVNLASRATAIAYPGSVVVSPDLRAALADHPDFAFRNLRPRLLKHIGRVQLAVLRRVDDRAPTIRDVIEERRRQVREAIVDRLGPLAPEALAPSADPAPPSAR